MKAVGEFACVVIDVGDVEIVRPRLFRSLVARVVKVGVVVEFGVEIGKFRFHLLIGALRPRVLSGPACSAAPRAQASGIGDSVIVPKVVIARWMLWEW